MPGTKSTKHVKDARVHEVLELMLKGAPRREICRYVAEKTEWNVSTRQIERYMKEARALIAETAERSRDVHYGLAQERLAMLLARTMNIQDFRTALGVLREMNRLEGLTNTQRLDINAELPDLVFKLATEEPVE